LALNIGVSAAETPLVLLLDADIRLDSNSISEMQNGLMDNAFVTVAEVREWGRPKSYPTEVAHLESIRHITELTINGRRVSAETSYVSVPHGCRSGPGLVLLRKDDYIRVGGMNSELRGWGWEDIDLVIRLQLSGLSRITAGRVHHVAHEHLPTNSSSQARNADHCLANYAIGKLTGTYDEDISNLRQAIPEE
jgi:GT2 family glycosyltransferase